MLLKRMQDKPKYRDTGLIKFAERSLELALEWEIFKNVMIKNMVSGVIKTIVNLRKSFVLLLIWNINFFKGFK